ncbi:MAG: ABC transporter permease subunit, partial [Acidimicrobiales bacterium]
MARVAAGLLALWVVWTVAGAMLPKGLPFGIVLLGLVLGGLAGLTAMGLVIVYRSARIVNFAQAEIGSLASVVAVMLVVGAGLPYFLALLAGLAVALLTGAVVELAVVRPLFKAPRLILTVATIGLVQVLGAGEIYIPKLFSNLRLLTFFTTPLKARFEVGPILFNGDYVFAMVVIGVVLVGLSLFFGFTDVGIAMRGAADSTDRALLLGIPVRRLSMITWVLAAGLSGVAAMLSAPIQGPHLGFLAGPVVLLTPLTAAVLARMESLTIAVLASLGIGVFEQAVLWNYPRSSAVDLGLFLLVIAGLLLQRRRIARVDPTSLGEHVAYREVRPIPAILRALPEVRWGRRAVGLIVAGLVLILPLGVSDSKRTLFAFIVIFAMLAVSMVVLTGWSGQISLGQFAFAGVGAGTTAGLFVRHVDLFPAIACAALAGAVVAVLIGIPALRIPGLFLAVATLAFAVPVNSFLLNSSYFPWLAPPALLRPAVLGRFDLASPRVFYYFCLLFLVGAMVVARNFRRSRPGRAAVAVRDNERGAASFSIDPIRIKLTAFALSGALAGVAGGLYVIALRGVGFAGYDPLISLQIFTMVVVGGLGTLTGAILGALYFQGAQYFLHGAAQLAATGGGIITVVTFAPAGLADVLYRGRDAGLRALARRKGLSVPTLSEQGAFGPAELSPSEAVPLPDGAPTRPTDRGKRRLRGPRGDGAGDAVAALACHGVDAAYGQVQVLFGVDLEVAEGEVVALLGTNGAGKSTLLRVVAGLLRPKGGEVILGGRDISGLGPVERVKAGIVTVPGGRGIFPSLTVGENLRLATWLSRRDRAQVAEVTREVFELFPVLSERLGVRAGDLSGGQQQMLTLAQALMCRPRLLMIDELSLGLAPTIVAQLLDVVRSLAAAGITVVVVEQSVNVATSLAGRAVFMERG